MANKTINLNEQMPLEEENEIPTKTLDSAVPASVQPDDQPPNGSGQPPPPAADNPAADGTKESGEAKSSSTVAKVAPQAGNDAAPADDVQKKIRRAERFGMPVQLSEAEKRSSRAERFGTGAGLNKSDVLSKSEELKRKARAERFGTLTTSADAADEEVKKKARLARFASGSAKTDPEEEDKRKARAIRFSNPSPSTLSQVNGKEAIAGKTTGGS
ncbi:protein MODIFIER OF SNC1 11 [Punica granatum]|uniref:THO1-MOS11 C-terminal domain-containing protein n=2 Tax=Punica granatum TaxID=22663 RepID=A0A218XBP1_PUNGR|nr:protein MODIFIER OF SNC1 11 [Punica granatum]OWM82363.1 hypothetical protein CDL15_Pgr001937 [Punica granatum]PKI62173.1 hypothetical protein CRG98_017546 [Punica granatum]